LKIPRWAVLAILAAGLGLRLWGIGFARTTPLGRPDEEIFLLEAMGMFNRAYRLLDLGFPEGFFRVWQLLIRLEHAVLQSIYGHLNPACLFALNPSATILPARVFSAVAGTATAGITGLLAGRLAPEHRVAATLWGMAVYAANYLVGRDGHFGVSDATLCLGVALTLLMCVRATEESPKWLLGAAAFAGLSFGVKASAIISEASYEVSMPTIDSQIVRLKASGADIFGNVDAFRENIRQLDLLFRIRWAGSQRRLRRIHHDPRRMHIRILDRGRNPVPEQREQSVVYSGKIDID